MIEIDWSRDLGRVLLLGSAAAVYAASKAAVDALARRAVTGVRFGVGQWIPIAGVVIAAIVLNQPELAVGVIFATSVASLSLVLGFSLFVSSIDLETPARRTGWTFVLPATLLAFLAGFKGHLSLTHAGVLFLQGLAILPLWQTRGEDDIPVAKSGDVPRRDGAWHIFQFLLAIALAGLAGWAATTGAAHVGQHTRVFTAGLLAVSVLSPALVLPAIGNGMFLAGRGQSWVVAEAGVVMTLLNLCFLLPLAIVLHYGRQIWTQSDAVAGTTNPTTIPDKLFPLGDPLPYPMMIWRLDTIALIVLGVLLLPVAARRLSLGRIEGLGLIFAYAVYLLWAVVTGIR